MPEFYQSPGREPRAVAGQTGGIAERGGQPGLNESDDAEQDHVVLVDGGQRWVRKKSRNTLKEKIEAKTRRNWRVSVTAIIAELNPWPQAGLATSSTPLARNH